MANYKVKGNVIKADISKLTGDELNAVKNYLALGYILEETEFKKGISKEEMLQDLKDFKDYKEDFELAYSIKKKEIENHKDTIERLEKQYGIKTKTKKGENIAGYHLACQIYTKWKKQYKKAEKKSK